MFILIKFSMKKTLNFLKLFHHRSENYKTTLVKPYSSSTFLPYQEHIPNFLEIFIFTKVSMMKVLKIQIILALHV
jgi:hypothetical protein